MEPVTSAVAISTIVSYFVKKLSDQKSVQNFFDDFSEATINWIKPLFIKVDGTFEKPLEDLRNKPDSPARQEAVKNIFAIALEDNPDAEVILKEMMKVIKLQVSALPNENVIYQRHTGSGDNVVNKIINENKWL